MQNQKKTKQLIGLTGGIASGKSIVARLFAMFGVPIYYSDARAKHIILHHQKVKNAIVDAFGTNSYTPDGAYNTKHISSIVFSDKEQLAKLNAIVHPAVFQDQQDWFAQLNNSYGIIESALLFETKTQANYDKIIVVAAADNIRVERIIQRNQLTAEQAQRRIASQLPQQEKIDQANFVIWNNEQESLIEQVNAIHNSIKRQ